MGFNLGRGLKTLKKALSTLNAMTFQGFKKKIQREIPAVSEEEKHYTGRRAWSRRRVTVYRAEIVAPQLSAKKPYFSTDPAHVYTLATCGAFVRVNKDRKNYTGKARKQHRREVRQRLIAAQQQAQATA